MKTILAAAALWMHTAAPAAPVRGRTSPPETRLPISLSGQECDLAAHVYRPAGDVL